MCLQGAELVTQRVLTGACGKHKHRREAKNEGEPPFQQQSLTSPLSAHSDGGPARFSSALTAGAWAVLCSCDGIAQAA